MSEENLEYPLAGAELIDRLEHETIANSPDAVFWVNDQSKLIRVNRAALTMHGYSEEEILRLTVFDLTDEFERTDWEGFWERLRASKTIRLESYHLRANGERFPTDETIIFVPGEDRDSAAVFVRDITERKRAEKELRDATAEIRRLQERLAEENRYLREEVEGRDALAQTGIVTRDRAFAGMLETAKRVAPTSSTVLLEGETGTGKELVARLLHEHSPRRDRAMVKVNCAALSKDLIESEWFGHEKGAFSGAHSRRKGRFEIADGGTLFLDEVGEIPVDLQPKLLRVLQEGDFERIGGNETIHTDVRVVAATNRDLRAEVAAGGFREDLYYRLQVFPLRLPPLRERPGDIRPLAEHFLRKHGARAGSRVESIGGDTADRLCAYSWPGNVRELENVIERALILSTGKTLLPEALALPRAAAEIPRRKPQAAAPTPVETRQSLRKLEAEAIRSALAACNGVIEGKNGAARQLEIAPSTLRDRIRKWGLDEEP